MFATMTTVWAPRVLSLVRIVSGLIFTLHGTQKLLNFPSRVPAPNTPWVPPEFGTMIHTAGLLEMVGGPLLLIGFLTRPVAFLLSGMMAVAYWMAHFKPDNIYPTTNGGDAAILYCFIFLYFVFSGPGPWSVDALFGGGSKKYERMR